MSPHPNKEMRDLFYETAREIELRNKPAIQGAGEAATPDHDTPDKYPSFIFPKLRDFLKKYITDTEVLNWNARPMSLNEARSFLSNLLALNNENLVRISDSPIVLVAYTDFSRRDLKPAIHTSIGFGNNAHAYTYLERARKTVQKLNQAEVSDKLRNPCSLIDMPRHEEHVLKLLFQGKVYSPKNGGIGLRFTAENCSYNKPHKFYSPKKVFYVQEDALLQISMLKDIDSGNTTEEFNAFFTEAHFEEIANDNLNLNSYIDFERFPPVKKTVKNPRIVGVCDNFY